MAKVFVICMVFLGMVLSGVSLAGSLKDNGDGTVTDRASHLMWQQQGEDGAMKWDAAITYCKNLSLAGYDDWLLPTKEELKSILSVGGTHEMKKSKFPTVNAFYWSSTTYAGNTLWAWATFNFSGVLGSADKTSLLYVRCVRGGQ